MFLNNKMSNRGYHGHLQRNWRLNLTIDYLKKRYSPERIAVLLGVSSSTVRGYINEIRYMDADEKFKRLELVRLERLEQKKRDDMQWAKEKLKKEVSFFSAFIHLRWLFLLASLMFLPVFWKVSLILFILAVTSFILREKYLENLINKKRLAKK